MGSLPLTNPLCCYDLGGFFIEKDTLVVGILIVVVFPTPALMDCGTIEGKVVNWKSRLWSIRQIFADCNVAFGDCESPLESKQSQLVSWSCPAYGIVGINTDGSSLGNPERQGQEV